VPEQKTTEDETYAVALERCSKLVTSAEVSAWARVKINFALGLEVRRLSSDSRYGDGVVKRLARDISFNRKKQIFESTLYDCRAVATFFGNLKEVKKLHNSSGEVTWGSLVAGVRKKKEQNELEEKAKTRDPEYVACLRQIKVNLRKLARYVKREEVTQELRYELRTELDDIASTVASVSDVVCEAENSKQINLLT